MHVYKTQLGGPADCVDGRGPCELIAKGDVGFGKARVDVVHSPHVALQLTLHSNATLP